MLLLMHLRRPPDSTIFQYIQLKMKEDFDTYITEPSDDELHSRGDTRYVYSHDISQDTMVATMLEEELNFLKAQMEIILEKIRKVRLGWSSTLSTA